MEHERCVDGFDAQKKHLDEGLDVAWLKEYILGVGLAIGGGGGVTLSSITLNKSVSRYSYTMQRFFFILNVFTSCA
jgi:hypothetical protein